MARRYVPRISTLYAPHNSYYRVLQTWMGLLIHPSSHLSLDSAQTWSILILMIHSHLRLKLSQALSLLLPPILKTWNQVESPQKVNTVITMMA